MTTMMTIMEKEEGKYSSELIGIKPGNPPNTSLNPIHLSNTFQAGHMLLRERPTFLLQPILQPSKHFPVPINAGAKCGLRRQGDRRLFMGTLHGWLELAGCGFDGLDNGPTTFTAHQSLLRPHVAELCVK